MHYAFIGALMTTVLLVACQNTSPSSKDTTAIPENLVQVDSTPAELAYVDPNADFSKFTAILLTPLGVDNVEIIQPQSSISTVGNSNWQLTAADNVLQMRERTGFEILPENPPSHVYLGDLHLLDYFARVAERFLGSAPSVLEAVEVWGHDELRTH